MRISIFAIAISFAVMSSVTASAYVEYIVGTMTISGCDYTDPSGADCIIKIEKHGPAPEGEEITDGVVAIDNSSATQVSGVIYVALPDNPYQWSNCNMTILSVFYTTDGSTCPIPQ